ncbi:PPOX class F420-dependent oxidoreductase [Microlunatus parietis]|uniref:PPOX class probable F420-dependent enzyme n=1 Tax=Microlunatus parietis TaxID=682979 RepID=A0A7Y9I6J0_9ACTN|nr:PPOX class F420-dependent oxidoreductase [Microlunatus parietis]NYE71201.1 PPOX class probable F420-dependent enzyme [Microlunatus parietis]
MSTLTLPDDLRDLIDSGPLVHLTTINPDGSPQVSVVWTGLDGDDLVTAHLGRIRKLRNLERDPRAVLSFLAPGTPGELARPYVTLRARGTVVETDDAWDLLNRWTKVYVDPNLEFPEPRTRGYVVRYAVDRIGGYGPWAD